MNKKLIFGLLSCLFCITIASCNDSEVIYEAKKYQISVVNSDDYKITVDKNEAIVNSIITVSVDVTNSNMYLKDVLYNDTSIFNNNSGTIYTFLMPEANVTVTAITANYEEKLVTDSSSRPFASFRSSDSKTLVKGTGNVNFHIDFNASYMSILNMEIVSTNTAVLTLNMISYTNEFVSMSYLISSSVISVNTANVFSGKTWLLFDIQNGNVSSQKGTLIVQIIVE